MELESEQPAIPPEQVPGLENPLLTYDDIGRAVTKLCQMDDNKLDLRGARRTRGAIGSMLCDDEGQPRPEFLKLAHELDEKVAAATNVPATEKKQRTFDQIEHK